MQIESAPSVAVACPECALCYGPGARRLRLPDPTLAKWYDILECFGCGKFSWVEVPASDESRES